jgi:hypothetical protein
MATLEDIDGKLDMLITSIATIEQRCVDRGRVIDGHGKTLYGDDGMGGMVSRVNTLSAAKLADTTRKEWAMRIMGHVITALVVAAFLGLLIMWKFSGA